MGSRQTTFRLIRWRRHTSAGPDAPCIARADGAGTRTGRGHLLTLLLLLSVASPLVAREEVSPARVEVLPRQVLLDGPLARQRLLAEKRVDGQSVGALADVVWTSSDDAVVRVESGVAYPVGDGRATLQASTSQGEASVDVEVRGMERPAAWEFRRHVLPVLSRLGCNTGACHGSLAGKGGFRLSLRGYHPEGDYQTISREARGRRIELADPAGSLLLTKPTGQVPHQGGLRLQAGSRDYQVLEQWIQQGAVPPADNDPALERLEVYPDATRLGVGDSRPFLVTAVYSDGRREDVTDWAKFSSSDESVAKVDEHGQVTVLGPGDTSIVVWFSSRLEMARVTVPFPNELASTAYEEFQPANFIDQHVLDRLRELRLQPSPRCSDMEFLRRAYLDTIGRLPQPAEVRLWSEDERPDKRRRCVDQLLAREEFVDYWTYRFSDLLLVNGRRLRPAAVDAYYGWLRSHVAQGTPWDQMVREILTARGSSVEQGATNFYALHQDPEAMTENACQAFLGLSIGCAKCHNHPLEKWTNSQYYAMASFFARVKAKGWGGESRGGDGVRTLMVTGSGELMQPLTGRPQPPTPLDGTPLDFDTPGDRREYLADWMVSPENSYFRRAIANRLWANFLGQGIVEPVDDLRVSNPARNERLLQALSHYLVDHRFDLKSLMREILCSETYQRSSEPLQGNDEDRHYFSRYYPRRLTAEVLLDAVSQVTEVPSKFTQIAYDGNDFEDTNLYPIGTRAVELKDSAIVSSFLQSFGRPERDITCECERSNTPSMVQVLHIHNGSTINERLRSSDSCVTRFAGASMDNEAVIREAFLRALTRAPTDRELERLAAELDSGDPQERRARIEDLYWGIMSSREFLFNH